MNQQYHYDGENADQSATWNQQYDPNRPFVPPFPEGGHPPVQSKKHTARNVVLASVMVLVGIGVAASLSQQPTDSSTPSTAVTPVDNSPVVTSKPSSKPTVAKTTTAPKPTAAPSPRVTHKPAPAMTVSQEQAVGTAQDYLDYQSFSRKGLIDQLKFEGFSSKDATFAVDYLKVNWNMQAVGVAKGYLDTQHFSRSGLIDQLEYEGFTHTQAVYGVDKAGL